MKFQIMIGILFTLLARRKVTATYLAGKYGISVRSVYRYVDEMTVCGVPIDVARGAHGGIRISDAYTIPKGLLTREEYTKMTDCLLAMNEQLHDSVLGDVIEKLGRREKSEERGLGFTGDILVDGGTWGDEQKFSDALAFYTKAIKERAEIEIDYVDRGGEHTHRVILPHLLVLKQNIWYVYAFCRLRNAFRLFKLGRIRSSFETGMSFERIPFERGDIPLSFWKETGTVDAAFEISPECLPFAEEWLGVTNVYEKDGKYFAEAVLPDDESLVGKILSAGSGMKVLAPLSLLLRVKKEVEKLTCAYSDK